jgi:mono/diheme cytochrome c family protein
MRKAEWFLRARLPCLGCHELDGKGGRIGPSLSSLAGRESADAIYQIIRHPPPAGLMPLVPMPGATLELVANYLVQRAATPPGQPATLAALPALPAADSGNHGAVLYHERCAPCHGAQGGGDGPNARFLPVRPTVHADARYMSTRGDADLFDAIYAGGFLRNRSNLMPPFGWTLSREEIWQLVHYLRTLCRCRGPDWSRDNQ